MKIRLDKLLVARGLAKNNERAQALILAGRVLVGEQPASKAGTPTDENAPLRMLGQDSKYVSRGGLKLEKALQHWKIDVRGKVCLDVGTSTGGFTDCLLQHGASRVIAVDTGYGQIDFRLRQDARVKLLEKTNARYLTAGQLGESFDLIAVDVSFISASKVLPPVIGAAFSPADGRAAGSLSRQIVVLVKPQFEVARQFVEEGGLVRNVEAQNGAVERIRNGLTELACRQIDVIESPILGMEGNREFLLHGMF